MPTTPATADQTAPTTTPIDLFAIQRTVGYARKALRGSNREGWWSENGCVLDHDDVTVAYGMSDTDAELIVQAPQLIDELATAVEQLVAANQELRVEWALAKLMSDTDGQQRGELHQQAIAAVAQIMADGPVSAELVVDALERLAAV
ncbi:MAG: hypothetical protein WKF57_06245 [Nakamurella sp.]